jgi:hypothetical protein
MIYINRLYLYISSPLSSTTTHHKTRQAAKRRLVCGFGSSAGTEARQVHSHFGLAHMKKMSTPFSWLSFRLNWVSRPLWPLFLLRVWMHRKDCTGWMAIYCISDQVSPAKDYINFWSIARCRMGRIALTTVSYIYVTAKPIRCDIGSETLTCVAVCINL